MLLDTGGIISVLSALGEHLEYTSRNPIELVICGGSALQVLGIADRTTRDMDVLAIMELRTNDEIVLLSAQPLPDVIMEAVAIVARDFGLPSDWLNPGPTQLLNEGLPAGLVSRLHSRSFGNKLTVHFIDRFDQICFKMYAVINGGGERHLSDLHLLQPSEDEILAAAKWCLTQDASEVFPYIVHSFLVKIGYSNVAERLESNG